MATIPTCFRSAAVIAALTLAVAAVGEEGKAAPERERIDKVPPAVRATIARESQGGKASDIVPALQNGTTVYLARYVVNGQRHVLVLAEDGSVIAHRSDDDGGDDD